MQVPATPLQGSVAAQPAMTDRAASRNERFFKGPPRRQRNSSHRRQQLPWRFRLRAFALYVTRGPCSTWSSRAASISTAPARRACAPTSASATGASRGRRRRRSTAARAHRRARRLGDARLPRHAHALRRRAARGARRCRESIRHGVTTVTVGSCSISTILVRRRGLLRSVHARRVGAARAGAAAAPRERRRWSTPREYVDFLQRHPLGANVDGVPRPLRPAHARARPRPRRRPARAPDARRAGADGALARGGARLRPPRPVDDDQPVGQARRRSLPLGAAAVDLRDLGRVPPAAPRAAPPRPHPAVGAEPGHQGQRALVPARERRLRLAQAAEAPRSSRSPTPSRRRACIASSARVTRFVNRVLGGDLRWQTLPVPFEVYADGIDLVVFEEFGAGQAALHLADEVARNALMRDEAYRRRSARTTTRASRRACGSATSTTRTSSPAPTPRVVGRSFGDGRRRARHPPGRRLPRSRRRARRRSCAGARPSPTIARARSSA